VITKDDVFDVMEEDLAVADMVLWVGISFEQSASTSYFRRVRSHRRNLVVSVLTPDMQWPPWFPTTDAGPTAFCGPEGWVALLDHHAGMLRIIMAWTVTREPC